MNKETKKMKKEEKCICGHALSKHGWIDQVINLDGRDVKCQSFICKIKSCECKKYISRQDFRELHFALNL